MTSFWPGIFLLAAAWIYAAPVLGTPDWRGGACASAGLLLFGLAARRTDGPRLTRVAAPLALVLIPTLVLLPGYHRLGPAAVMAGIIGWALGRKPEPFAGFFRGIVLGGLILCLHSVTLPLYSALAARQHDTPALAPVVAALVRAFGKEVAVSGSSLFTRAGGRVVEFTVTHEKLGAYALLCLWEAVGLTAAFVGFRSRRRALCAAGVCGLAWLPVRYSVLVLVTAEWGNYPLFWSRAAMAFSLFPLAALCAWAAPLRASEVLARPAAPRRQRAGRPAVFGALLAAATFSLVCAVGFHDPGVKKDGRVILDEAHSDWEGVSREYDTEWYGQASGYNYFSLAQHLARHYALTVNTNVLTDAALSKASILIVKIPTAPFSPEEVRAVVRFVKNGGGLLLIGDHTNVFGSSTYLNPLAREFGLRFEYDATYELHRGGLYLYRRPSPLYHPILGRVPFFLFGTSCSLDAPLSVHAPMIAHGMRSAEADYARESFFGADVMSPRVDVGSFVVLAALSSGKGRVVAFTDSTVFSNFWMFLPGKPELLLGMTEWLNRQSRWDGVNRLCLIAALGFLLASCRFFRFAPAHGLAAAVAIGLALPAAILGLRASDRAAYPPPVPTTAYTRVAFDGPHSDMEIPSRGFPQRPERDFHTFYVWSQRLGFVPEVVTSFTSALASADIMVVANPIRSFSASECRRARRFVENGGLLIVMDCESNRESTRQTLLDAFGITIRYHQGKTTSLRNGEGLVIAGGRPDGRVLGGVPIVTTDSGGAAVSVGRCGRGKVIVVADSELFSALHFGSVNSVPDEFLLRRYAIEYWMLSQCHAESDSDSSRLPGSGSQ